MYIRGNIPSYKLAKEVKTASITEKDLDFLKNHLSDYCNIMKLDLNAVMAKPFTKLYPHGKRPYGKLYAY